MQYRMGRALRSPGSPLGPADRELARALREPREIRQQRLVVLSERYEHHGPTWLALAEEHMAGRRTEEAVTALEHALAAEPGLATYAPRELLALCSLPGRGVAPPASRQAPQPAPSRGEPRPASSANARAKKRSSSRGRRSARPGPALEDVLRGSPLERKRQLERLSHKYPYHGPIWLALAEELLVRRQVDEAARCHERALACEPSLAGQESDPLNRALALHRRAELDRQKPRPGGDPTDIVELGDVLPGYDASPYDSLELDLGADVEFIDDAIDARAVNGAPRDAAAGSPRRFAGESASLTGRASPEAVSALLDEGDNKVKLAGLRKLRDEHPDDPVVLFHLALVLARVGEASDARETARELRELSPQRFHLLMEVARSYWPRDGDKRPANARQPAGDAVIVEPGLLNGVATAKPSDATVAIGEGAAQVARLCDRCWAVFAVDPGVCPDKGCGATRPHAGWPTLPFLFREQYRFTQLLGRGSSCAVFRAQNAAGAGREVAVKVIRHALADAPAVRRRFAQEARAVPLLGQDRHFIRVSGLELEGPRPYLAMELIEWPTLRDVIRHEGPLDGYQVACLGSSILEGLCVLHEHGMIHRDLRPENIFVDLVNGAFQTKIAGLGCSAYEGRPQVDLPPLPPGATSSAYLSPEQTKDVHLTRASDIHSLGSILWELSTGCPPFPAHGPNTAQRAVFHFQASQVVPIRPPHMSGPLYQILTRGLTHEPERRWSAAELRKALNQYAFSHMLGGGAPERVRAAPRPAGSTMKMNMSDRRAWWHIDERTLPLIGIAVAIIVLLLVLLLAG